MGTSSATWWRSDSLAEAGSSGSGLRPAVFLDRDGTIIEDVGFLHTPLELRLLPGAARAITVLREVGFLVVIVSNQSGIARGYLTEEGLGEIHSALRDELRAHGTDVDAIYYCPHLPDGTVGEYARECECRKPSPGMLLRAARELSIDLSSSFAVGDSERDVLAGRNAGCCTILLGGESAEETAADALAPNLLVAASMIMGGRL